MRRRIQQVPTDLPHASLYLDDIETVTKILIEAVSEADAAYDAAFPRGKEDSPSASPKVIYQIGQDEMDSIDDLLSQGGSVVTFSVRVSGSDRSWARCDLHFRWPSTPALALFGIRKEGKEWEIHGKVREVFEKRRSLVKNLIEDLPASVMTGGGAFVALSGIVMAFLKGTANTVLRIVVIFVFFSFLFGGIAVILPNRVYLMRSHERSRAASEVRWRYIINAITFAAGALFTKLVDHFIARVLK